jgi:hypothetical protein
MSIVKTVWAERGLKIRETISVPFSRKIDLAKVQVCLATARL